MLKSDDKVKIILKGDLSRLEKLAAEEIVIDSAKTIQKRTVGHTAHMSSGGIVRTAVSSAQVKAEASSSKSSSSSIKSKLREIEVVEVDEPRKRRKTEEAPPAAREQKKVKDEPPAPASKKKSVAPEAKKPAQPSWEVGDTVYVSVLTWYNYGMCPFPDSNRSYCEGRVIAKSNNKYTLRFPCFEEEYVKPLSYMLVRPQYFESQCFFLRLVHSRNLTENHDISPRPRLEAYYPS